MLRFGGVVAEFWCDDTIVHGFERKIVHGFEKAYYSANRMQ